MVLAKTIAELLSIVLCIYLFFTGGMAFSGSGMLAIIFVWFLVRTVLISVAALLSH